MAAVAWQETCAIAQASYRLMAQALITNMIAAGLVQTSDTGQINPSTIVIPTGGGSSGGVTEEYGYVMFRMNDSLAATLPVYIKLIFGAYFGNNSSTRRCGLKISIGFATDGAGNLTGPVKELISSGPTLAGTNTELAGPHPSWCHHKEGSVALLAYRANWRLVNGVSVNADFPLHFFVIERTRDAAGNPTAEGINIMSRGQVASSTWAANLTLGNLFFTNSYHPLLDTHYLSPSLSLQLRTGGIWLGQTYTGAKAGAVQMQDIWSPGNSGTPFKTVKLYRTTGANVGDTTSFEVDGVSTPFLMAGSWAFLSELFIPTGNDGAYNYKDISLAIEWV